MFDEDDGKRFRLRPESPDDSTLIGIGSRKEKALIFYFDREEKRLEDESQETMAQELWLKFQYCELGRASMNEDLRPKHKNLGRAVTRPSQLIIPPCWAPTANPTIFAF